MPRAGNLRKAGELYDDVAASLLRALSGFLISVVLIVPLGLAVGWYARLGDLLNQFIEICRNTAPLALLPVFILLLGIGELSKITMVVYSCAWPLLLNTIAAVKQVDPLLIKSARTMGATPQQLFRKVILPASLPTIFVGIRLASASAMLVLVASEMVGAKAGLGYLIINSQYSFLIPQMYFGILGITVIGLTFNAILRHWNSASCAGRRRPRREAGETDYDAAGVFRAVACVTTLFGGTSFVSQTLPPIVEPRPIVIRPRMVAPA